MATSSREPVKLGPRRVPSRPVRGADAPPIEHWLTGVGEPSTSRVNWLGLTATPDGALQTPATWCHVPSLIATVPCAPMKMLSLSNAKNGAPATPEQAPLLRPNVRLLP